MVSTYELYQLVRIRSFHGPQILPVEIVADAQEGVPVVQFTLLDPELGRRFLKIDSRVHNLVPFLGLRSPVDDVHRCKGTTVNSNMLGQA